MTIYWSGQKLWRNLALEEKYWNPRGKTMKLWHTVSCCFFQLLSCPVDIISLTFLISISVNRRILFSIFICTKARELQSADSSKHWGIMIQGTSLNERWQKNQGLEMNTPIMQYCWMPTAYLILCRAKQKEENWRLGPIQELLDFLPIGQNWLKLEDVKPECEIYKCL